MMKVRSVVSKLLLGLLGLTALSLSPASVVLAEEPVTVRLLCIAGPRYSWTMEAVAKEYMKRVPNVRIEIDGYPYDQFQEKVVMAAATLDSYYDILNHDNQSFGLMLDTGFTAPLDDYIEANPEWWNDLKSDVPPNILMNGFQRGKWMALMVDANAMMMFYRKDLLEKAGLSVPRTWDEVFEVAAKLHSPPSLYGVGGHFQRFWALDIFESLLFSAGGELWNKDYVPQFTTEAAYWAMSVMKRLFPYSPPESISWGEGELLASFGAGSIGLIPVTWGHSIPMDPKMSKYHNVIAGSPVPLHPTTGKGIGRFGGAPLALNRYGKHPKEAFDFLKFYLSREGQKIAALNTGQPVRLSVLRDPEVVKIAPYFPALEKAIQTSQQIPLDAEMLPIQQSIGLLFSRMLLGEVPIEEGMRTADEIVADIFRKSGKLKTAGR